MKGKRKAWVVVVSTALLVLAMPPFCGLGGGSYSEVPPATVDALATAVEAGHERNPER